MVVRTKIVKDSASVKSPQTKVTLELGNDCKIYVAPDGVMYKAGVVYPMDYNEAEKLLSHRDDKNIRYFYEITEESLEKRKRAKARALARLAERLEEAEGVIEEIDTGAMKLEDSAGNSVGVVSV